MFTFTHISAFIEDTASGAHAFETSFGVYTFMRTW